MEDPKIEQLLKPSLKTLTLESNGAEVTICKIKRGARRALMTEVVTLDEDRVAINQMRTAEILVGACLVEPELTPEQIDELDEDAFLELSREIATHSNLLPLMQPFVDPDATAALLSDVEGSDAHESFPVGGDGQPAAGPEVGDAGDGDADNA